MKLTGEVANATRLNKGAHGIAHTEATTASVDKDDGAVSLGEELGDEGDNVVDHDVAASLLVVTSKVVERVDWVGRAGVGAGDQLVEGGSRVGRGL